MNEFSLIALIAERCNVARADVRLGIGDDAAIVAVPAGHDVVICTDTLVSGVHFPLSTSAFDIGWKALAVNLSDIASMGAIPAWATLALTLPSPDPEFVAAFADGFAELAARHHVALVGGDTTRGPLSITVSVHGLIATGQGVRRDGARVGDGVYVTGTLGDAAAGLALLQSSRFLADATTTVLIDRLNRPSPRLAAGSLLRDLASSCIDVSDGLMADLGHVAERSGVAIEIDVERLPSSAALLSAVTTQARAGLQLGGGDDYELAFTVSPDREHALLQDLARSGEGATRIGRVVEGSGVRVFDANGDLVIVPIRGWDHFG